MRHIGLVACLVLAVPSHAQNASEDAFANAGRWTVYVRGTLATPFADDDQGTWSGSGFLVDRERGWILTNAHVASRSPVTLTVQFQGGTPQPASRVYVDPYLDVAVVRIETRTIPESIAQAPLNCDRLPPTGHPVGAFGHPWGYRFTGTRGITSAITNKLGPDMIQTDAAINGGNSGGPLISLESGKVLGINTAKASNGVETAEGISFAVPMTHACRILELLKADGDPSPPERLISFAIAEGDEPTLTIARSRLPTDAMALRAGDTITAVNDRPVHTQGQLVNALRGRLPDVRVTVEREGTALTLRGRLPAAPQVLDRAGVMISGALFAEVPPMLSNLLRDTTALMIHHVESGSPAEAAELAALDLVMSVNGGPVTSLNALEIIALNAPATSTLDIVVMRVDSPEEMFSYRRSTLPNGIPVHINNRNTASVATAAR